MHRENAGHRICLRPRCKFHVTKERVYLRLWLFTTRIKFLSRNSLYRPFHSVDLFAISSFHLIFLFLLPEISASYLSYLISVFSSGYSNDERSPAILHTCEGVTTNSTALLHDLIASKPLSETPTSDCFCLRFASKCRARWKEPAKVFFSSFPHQSYCRSSLVLRSTRLLMQLLSRCKLISMHDGGTLLLRFLYLLETYASSKKINIFTDKCEIKKKSLRGEYLFEEQWLMMIIVRSYWSYSVNLKHLINHAIYLEIR